MTEKTKWRLTFAAAALVVIAALLLFTGPGRAILKEAGGLFAVIGAGGIMGLFAAIEKKIKRGKQDAPKTKDEIMADDPKHSIDRLPDDARAKLDADSSASADAQAADVFSRYSRKRRDGRADASGTGGGAQDRRG